MGIVVVARGRPLAERPKGEPKPQPAPAQPKRDTLHLPPKKPK